MVRDELTAQDVDWQSLNDTDFKAKVAERQPITDAERQAAFRFIAQAQKTREEQNVSQPEKMAIADFCQILLCANEFIYVD
jgi:hypothetical protein